MTEGFIAAIIGAIATAVGVGVTIITIHYQRKQYKFSSLIEAFKLLNDANHREARTVTYGKFKNKPDIRSSTIREALAKHGNADILIEEFQGMVRADFDQMGSLVKNRLLPEKAFLDVYWETVLDSWRSLENDIKEEREKRHNPAYMKNFEELKSKAEAYRKNTYPDIHTEVY